MLLAGRLPAVVDVSDRSNPKLITRKVWSPPFGGRTHNALPVPGRDLLVVVDETVLDDGEDGFKPIWVFGNQIPSIPISIATYQNTGVRVYDIRNPLRSEKVGACVPPAPARKVDPRPNRPAMLNTADVHVDRDGIVCCTDFNAGLTIMEYRG